MHTAVSETERLNALLRRELAALETYQQALERLQQDPSWVDLNRIQQDHGEAVDSLKEQVRHFDARPAGQSGAWGTWAKLVEGTAMFFGKTAALTALKEGERYGVRYYQSALFDENLSDESKALIRWSLLPRTQTHLRMLDQLLQK
jgi:hypothetical protein